jgi:RNA polymerase sigma factor for flagellar operon FliA
MNPAELELWRAWRRTNDPRLRERLIERYLPLVKSVAAWVAGRLPSHLRLDDLYSAGMLGFLDAIEHYDPEVGVAFATYADARIRGAIFDDLRRLDCVPRRVRRQIRDAQQAFDRLCQRLDREPAEEEIAAELGIDVAQYRRLLDEGVTLVPLDAPPGRLDEPGQVRDTVADAGLPDPLLALESKERRVRLGRIIDGLPERERQVLALYYFEELTMAEVGKVLGVTESRVSQIHSSAVMRLRNALRRHRLNAADLEVATPTGGAVSGFRRT